MIAAVTPDTLEGKEKHVRTMLRLTRYLPPVYIISSRRAGAVRTLETFPYLVEHGVILVVAEEEAEEYVHAYPGVNIQVIPRGYRGHGRGVGRARQFVFDHAMRIGLRRIMVLDDDITNLRLQYSTPDGVRTALPPGWDRTEWRLGLLTLLARVGEEAFMSSREVTLFGPALAPHFNSAEASGTRWETNSGRIPVAGVMWDVPRFSAYVGEIDLDGFNRHGEDLYAALRLIENGGDIAKAPSFTLDVDTTAPSTVKPASEAGQRATYAAEHDALTRAGLLDLVYTKWDEEHDAPLWSRPDWRKIRRSLDHVSQRRVRWEDSPAWEFEYSFPVR